MADLLARHKRPGDARHLKRIATCELAGRAGILRYIEGLTEYRQFPRCLRIIWLAPRRAASRDNALRIACSPSRVACMCLPVALIIYAFGLLWPFEFRARPELPTMPSGLRLGPFASILPGSPCRRPCQIGRKRAARPGISVVVEGTLLQLNQSGPARLFTLARDTSVQDLVIGQAGDDLVIRLRGLCRGLPAHGRTCPKRLWIPAVFATPEWVDLDLRVEPNRVTLRAGNRPPLEVLTAEDPLRGWIRSTGWPSATMYPD